MNVSRESLKAKIYSILSDKTFKDKLYSYKEIRKKLGNKFNVGQEELLSVLEELVVEGKIMKNRKGLFRVFSHDLGFLQCKLTIDEIGNGYVEIATEDENGKKIKTVYKIYSDDLNDALLGDIVLIKTVDGTSKGKPLAVVERIIKRSNSLIFCNVRNINGEMVIIPELTSFKHPIRLRKQERDSLEEGQRVLVNIGELIGGSFYEGSIANPSVAKEDSKAAMREEKRQNDYLNADGFDKNMYFDLLKPH